MGSDLRWQEIKWKLEEMYSPIATEVHTASNPHRKHCPDKILQEYIQKCMDLTEKAMGAYSIKYGKCQIKSIQFSSKASWLWSYYSYI